MDTVIPWAVGWLSALVALIVWWHRRPPGPPPAPTRPRDADLERAHIEREVATREERLRPLRETARNVDADSRTKDLMRLVDR